MTDECSINLWVNEARHEKLRGVGLADLAQDALAGMKVLQLRCTTAQKDRVLELYPMAKFDSATTKTIELLPAEAKDAMFDLAVQRASLHVIGEFLENVS